MSETVHPPKGWKSKTIRNLLKDDKFAVVDGPFGTQLHVSDYVKSGIPLIRIKNILWNNEFNFNDLVYITEEKFQELKRSSIYPNDILLAKTGATIGKLCLFPSEFKKGLSFLIPYLSFADLERIFFSISFFSGIRGFLEILLNKSKF